MESAFRYYFDDADTSDAPAGDFGPYSIAYMMETGGNFINHHLLPRPGGWDDQPADWVEALKVWLAWHAHMQAQTSGKQGGFDPLEDTGGMQVDWFNGG